MSYKYYRPLLKPACAFCAWALRPCCSFSWWPTDRVLFCPICNTVCVPSPSLKELGNYIFISCLCLSCICPIRLSEHPISTILFYPCRNLSLPLCLHLVISTVPASACASISVFASLSRLSFSSCLLAPCHVLFPMKAAPRIANCLPYYLFEYVFHLVALICTSLCLSGFV